MKVNIDSVYFSSVDADVDLPVSSWEEIGDWYVKWGVFHYALKSVPDEWQEVDLGSDLNTDFKRPASVDIHPIEYDPDYGEHLNYDIDLA